MARILKGSDVVDALNERIIREAAELREKGVSPVLAILRVGERSDDVAYERNAIKRCEKTGVAVSCVSLPEDVEQPDLIGAIRTLNNDDSVHGVLMLRPLPWHLAESEACAALLPEKDVDGITEESLAGVFTGSGRGFAPCTAQACIELLDYYGVECAGKRAVIVGRSLVVGKPVAVMMLNKHATVTVCHTRTVNLPSVTKNAEILIVAAGNMECITREHLSPGQVVIDVGINWNDEKRSLCGDVRFDDADKIVGAITPVPGGAGTVTTSVLVSHVVQAAKNTLIRKNPL